jgi:hypothetical protein
MTEIAIPEPVGIVQRQDSMHNAAVERLGDWAEAAGAAYQVAQRLVETSFVPAQFKGKPAEATAAILSGAEVGLSPMASLKSFDIIQGTAAPRALTLRAIVQSQGHEMILEESTEARCKMRGRRRGETEWTKVQWTIDRAKGLGLTTKDNWKKQPAAMLVARATGELARLIAADAILGIGYTIEEVADGADVALDMTDEPQPATTGTRTMQRKPADAPTEEVNRDAIPADQDAITDKQSALLHKLVTDLGLDRDAKLAGISVIVERKVESSKDLTRVEAGKVIDSLTATLAERKGELPVEASA